MLSHYVLDFYVSVRNVGVSCVQITMGAFPSVLFLAISWGHTGAWEGPGSCIKRFFSLSFNASMQVP